jgi:uncharacterized membrane protein YdjX (TVP38/TMEM64 family)
MTPVLRMNQARRRGVLLVVIVIGLLSALLVFARHVSTNRAVESGRAFIESLGWEGMAVYVVLFVIGSFLMLPATALSAIAPLLFGPWPGFAAIVAGNMAAAVLMFGVARWAGRRWEGLRRLPGRLPGGLARLAHGNGLLLVFYSRLLMAPASVVNYAAALLPVSYGEMFWGTFLGVLPHCLSTALSIGLLRDAWLEGRWSALLRWEAALLAATYAVTFWAVYRLRGRMRRLR